MRLIYLMLIAPLILVLIICWVCDVTEGLCRARIDWGPRWLSAQPGSKHALWAAVGSGRLQAPSCRLRRRWCPLAWACPGPCTPAAGSSWRHHCGRSVRGEGFAKAPIPSIPEGREGGPSQPGGLGSDAVFLPADAALSPPPAPPTSPGAPEEEMEGPEPEATSPTESSNSWTGPGNHTGRAKSPTAGRGRHARHVGLRQIAGSGHAYVMFLWQHQAEPQEWRHCVVAVLCQEEGTGRGPGARSLWAISSSCPGAGACAWVYCWAGENPKTGVRGLVQACAGSVMQCHPPEVAALTSGPCMDGGSRQLFLGAKSHSAIGEVPYLSPRPKCRCQEAAGWGLTAPCPCVEPWVPGAGWAGSQWCPQQVGAHGGM